MATALALVLLVSLQADPPQETDAENRARCRAAGQGLRVADRVWAQEKCRKEYLGAVEAVRAAERAKERAERAQRERDLEARRRADREAQAAALRSAQEDAAAKNAAEAPARAEAEERRLKAEALAKSRFEAEEKANARRAAAEDAKWAAHEAKLKAEHEARVKACGDDYLRVEVGMAWDRVRQCAGPFTVVGQVQRPDGVASTFSAPGGVVLVMDGKVVAWRRRP